MRKLKHAHRQNYLIKWLLLLRAIGLNALKFKESSYHFKIDENNRLDQEIGKVSTDVGNDNLKYSMDNFFKY